MKTKKWNNNERLMLYFFYKYITNSNPSCLKKIKKGKGVGTYRMVFPKIKREVATLSMLVNRSYGSVRCELMRINAIHQFGTTQWVGIKSGSKTEMFYLNCLIVYP